MIILDTNILVYAHVPDLPQHTRVARWLKSAMRDGTDSIGIIWHVLCGFLRITTNPRIFNEPMTIQTAKLHMDVLLSHPMFHQVHTTDNHWEIYSAILTEMNITGDVVPDAHVAAIAFEHKAAVASANKDFRRFSDYVKIIDPLKA